MGKIDFISSQHVEKEEEFLPYFLGTSPEEAEETYREFSKLLATMASSYEFHTGISKDDYFGEALTGLARAKRDFDPKRGNCKFRTFAVMKIKNALNEYCRRNKTIVTIPSYVRIAHMYITNIKTILEGYGVEEEEIEGILSANKADFDYPMADADRDRVVRELEKLDNLAENSSINYTNLVSRGEFVPSDMAYDETLDQDELINRERQKMAAALIVSDLRDKMTYEEIHVAEGIMAGKSYKEIGKTHDPPRSIGWVQKQLAKMKEKFSNDT